MTDQTTPSISEIALQKHREHQGKLGVQSLVSLKTREDLSWAYTPGVAEPCRVIAADPQESFNLTMRGRTMAVISDGSAVLGLGNIGPEAAMPVMEGKALLMKEFAGVDCVPLVINTQDSQEIIKFVRQVAPSFAGINLEDIAAPRCFEIEDALQDLGIAVFHDDQHGTAIVVTAALRNAAKVVGKKYEDLQVVVVGAGAAGLATAQMLLGLQRTTGGFQSVAGVAAVRDLIVVDSKGAIVTSRTDLNGYKQAIAQVSNKSQLAGSAVDALRGADVVIGVSGPGTISAEMVKGMADQAIVFALANPTPEIMPNEAHAAGAAVVATGRSDFPNQINNVLAFPGIFKAIRDARLKQVTTPMKLAAADALAALVETPTTSAIIPDPFDERVVVAVSTAVLAIS